ncbi:MAG: hypothetical protein HOD60_11660 [Candidatus Nitrosopelagicus sp.]|jgi:hypothetical protein|nr:hypothetical protein [Candidatus Nitrosopelagicus sp.]
MKKIRKINYNRSQESSLYLNAFAGAIAAELITKDGRITPTGTKLYLSLLHVMRKNTVHDAPKKQSRQFISIKDLVYLEYIIHDGMRNEYVLSSKCDYVMKVLAKSLSGNAVPNID